MNNKLRLTAFLGAVVLITSVTTVVATHVEPETHDGNPTCSDYEPEGMNWTEFKIEPVLDGNYSDGTLNVTLSIDGKLLDWESDIGIVAVVVKGGPGANLYEYNPAATADDGVHAPTNPGGQMADLSHVSFCYEAPSEPPGEDCPIYILVAVANDDGSITVTGNASGMFDLYRKAGGGEAEFIGTFDGAFEYHDTDTVTGKSYTYLAFHGEEQCAQVEVTAIPVFPTVLAAAAAVGLSVLGYAALRRRM
jgi:hypothetical protein